MPFIIVAGVSNGRDTRIDIMSHDGERDVDQIVLQFVVPTVYVND